MGKILVHEYQTIIDTCSSYATAWWAYKFCKCLISANATSRIQSAVTCMVPEAREGASYSAYAVEHHFSQVDHPMSKFGMHFYGMDGPLYTRKAQPTFHV